MSRSVPEWIGKTPGTAIPTRVALRVIERQNGRCGCGCGVKLGLYGEGTEIDHIEALINGGENRESNLQALRRPCHVPKTKEDVAEKSRTAKVKAKRYGLKKPKRKIPGRRFNGDPIRN